MSTAAVGECSKYTLALLEVMKSDLLILPLDILQWAPIGKYADQKVYSTRNFAVRKERL